MKTAERIYYILLGLFFLWIFASYLDIIADNIAPNPTHSIYNFFVVITKLWEA